MTAGVPTISHPDKFGYYQSGAFKTYRKLEAIQAYDRTGAFPEWNFNRQIFDRIDWYHEPKDDLWSFYRQRCRQIRDAYDYCVLFYSGGSDSDNILRAWIDAGCTLDEIATIKISSATTALGNFDWAVEVPQVVEPTIRLLKQQGLDFRYREIDSVAHTVDYLRHSIDDYFFQASQSFSPNNTMKSRLRETIADYRDIIDSGRKLCLIWGSDKPQIRYDPINDQWFFDFVDIVDNCVSPYVQEKHAQGWYDELFYWTPDLPLMLVKQAHALRRWCMTVHDPGFYQKNPTPYGYNRLLDRFLTVDAAKIVLYPRWDTKTLVAPKPKFGSVRPGQGYLTYSERDRWFFSDHGNLQKRYEDQVESIIAYLRSHSRWNWLSVAEGHSQTIWTHSRQSHRFS